jgi:hypothetical protein
MVTPGPTINRTPAPIPALPTPAPVTTRAPVPALPTPATTPAPVPALPTPATTPAPVPARPTPAPTPAPVLARPTPAPTLAPVPAGSTCTIVIDPSAQSGYPVCNVCGAGRVMRNPDAQLGELPFGDVEISVSCGCADLAGQLGFIPACGFARAIVAQARVCDCGP